MAKEPIEDESEEGSGQEETAKGSKGKRSKGKPTAVQYKPEERRTDATGDILKWLDNPPVEGKHSPMEPVNILMDDWAAIYRGGHHHKLHEALFGAPIPADKHKEFIKQRLAYELQYRGQVALGLKPSAEFLKRRDKALNWNWASRMNANAFLQEDTNMAGETKLTYVVDQEGNLVGRYTKADEAKKNAGDKNIVVNSAKDLAALSISALTTLFNSVTKDESKHVKKFGDKPKAQARAFEALQAMKVKLGKTGRTRGGKTYADKLRDLFATAAGKKGLTLQQIAEGIVTTPKNASVAISIARNKKRCPNPINIQRGEDKLYHVKD